MTRIWVRGLLLAVCCASLGIARQARGSEAALLPPAHVTAACSQLQPRIDLSQFGQTHFTVQHPRVMYRAYPNFPSSLLNAPVHTLVSVCVLVSPSGEPTKPVILYSSGYRALDDAALRAARATTFAAGSINGKRLAMAAELDYRFDAK